MKKEPNKARHTTGHQLHVSIHLLSQQRPCVRSDVVQEMKKNNIQRWLTRGAVLALLLLTCWISFYSYRSQRGSYHEIVHDGGIASALWFPSDFEPRQLAVPQPTDPTKRIPGKRYAPKTRLPQSFPLDEPLLMIDRWLFHESVQTISGHGDMPRLYRLSNDGRTLIPST